jgi:hypothetical protein
LAAHEPSVDADWKRLDVPATVGGAGYKGAWDAAANTLNLNDPALLATLRPGDFYKVAIPGNTTLNGISGWQQNDSTFWDGSVFGKFQNTNPAAVQPLYADTDGARFQTDVLALIRLNALTEHRPGRGFEINTYVKSTYAVDSKTHVDTYMATQTMGANAAALPTPTAPNPNWQLISTTNGAKLGGTAQGNDTRGRAASGAFTPATRTPNEYLSPEEVDARIRQYGGKSTEPLLGGNAATLLTADTAETPRNLSCRLMALNRLVLRSDITSERSLTNPVLARNELVYDETKQDFKHGDGVSTFLQLPYLLQEKMVWRGVFVPGYYREGQYVEAADGLVYRARRTRLNATAQPVAGPNWIRMWLLQK